MTTKNLTGCFIQSVTNSILDVICDHFNLISPMLMLISLFWAYKRAIINEKNRYLEFFRVRYNTYDTSVYTLRERRAAECCCKCRGHILADVNCITREVRVPFFPLCSMQSNVPAAAQSGKYS